MKLLEVLSDLHTLGHIKIGDVKFGYFKKDGEYSDRSVLWDNYDEEYLYCVDNKQLKRFSVSGITDYFQVNGKCEVYYDFTTAELVITFKSGNEKIFENVSREKAALIMGAYLCN